MTNYVQCRLQDANDRQQVAWIEERGAKIGHRVTLKEDDTTWEVISASPFSLPYDVVNERSQDYKRTRKASDV